LFSVEQLESFDSLLWYRGGSAAAAACRCDESSITRRVKQVLRLGGLALTRGQEFEVYGDLYPLRLERSVHQYLRFKGNRPLRIEIGNLISSEIRGAIPGVWQFGSGDYRPSSVMSGFLRERVIDAWITSVQLDLESLDDLIALPLWSSPLTLFVHPSHPLASLKSFSKHILRSFPSLELPDYFCPTLSNKLKRIGLSRGTTLRRFDKGSLLEAASDCKTIVYGSCLTNIDSSELTPIAFDTGIDLVSNLVMRSDVSDTQAFSSILASLTELAQALQSRHLQLQSLL